MRRKDRQVTDVAAILGIIEAADACCLGMIDDSGPVPQPYVVALNYGFEAAPDGSPGGIFWFHCAREGHKLDLLRRNPQVCVQLDCDHQPVVNALGCGWGMKYASVVAMGRAQIIEDPVERRRGLDCVMDHYRRLWGTPPNVPSDRSSAATQEPGKNPQAAESPHYDEKVLAMTAVIRLDVESLTAKRKA
jgi:nitroimidazol reductase NimA-like FMN-containing flavoprotein (pyridoxamine 5'-phosphate oxidase superfamily)